MKRPRLLTLLTVALLVMALLLLSEVVTTNGRDSPPTGSVESLRKVIHDLDAWQKHNR